MAAPDPNGPRVVILRALGLGDLLTVVPALRALARAFPAHRRVLVAPAWLAPVVRMLEGAVTDISHADFRRRVGTVPPRASGVNQPDVAVNVHGAGPDSHRALLALQPQRMIAFARGDVGWAAPASWREDEHELARWCRLLDAHGIPADPADLHLDVRPSPHHPWRGAILLHPGAASASRRWPQGRWTAVARQLHQRGHDVVLTGSKAERPLAVEIARAAGLPDGAVAAGRTDLQHLAHGVAAADLLVCGDTGVAHLATAVGTRSVLLFGPTAPARWGPPPGLDVRHAVLWSGRTGDPHGTTADPGLLEIGVEQVLDALRLLREGPARLREPSGQRSCAR